MSVNFLTASDLWGESNAVEKDAVLMNKSFLSWRTDVKS
jgi:hypothetical protein